MTMPKWIGQTELAHRRAPLQQYDRSRAKQELFLEIICKLCSYTMNVSYKELFDAWESIYNETMIIFLFKNVFFDGLLMVDGLDCIILCETNMRIRPTCRMQVEEMVILLTWKHYVSIVMFWKCYIIFTCLDGALIWPKELAWVLTATFKHLSPF